MMKLILSTLAAAFVGTTAIAADKAPATPEGYPLDTCVISGEKLGSMGKPVVIEHDGKKVVFCCKGCTKKFNSDPAKYLKKIEDAAAKK